jgi:hypothetical protein
MKKSSRDIEIETIRLRLRYLTWSARHYLAGSDMLTEEDIDYLKSEAARFQGVETPKEFFHQISGLIGKGSK